MRTIANLCLASGIAIAGCASTTASVPGEPAQDVQSEVRQAPPGLNPVTGAVAGAVACAVYLLWLYPPACGAAVLLGGAIGVAHSARLSWSDHQQARK